MVMLGIKFAFKAILIMFRIEDVGLGNVQTSRVSVVKLKSLITRKG